MAGYGTEQESMTRGAAAVEEAATTITQQLGRLDSEVETMFGGWSSDAQRSFAALHAAWAEQQQKLVGALHQMHVALVKTGQAYAAQEEQQSDTFRNMSGDV